MPTSLALPLSLILLWLCHTARTQGTLDLSNLKSNTLDLKGRSGTLEVKGNWNGDRLIIKNAQNLILNFRSRVRINSTHKEDALILENPVKLTIKGNRKLHLNQSITVWGNARQLTLDGIQINGAHTGIRINQNQPYQDLSIQNCSIKGCQFEGIYIGPHYKSKQQLARVIIRNNQISNCGWDGIQVGNCLQFELFGNKVSNCGKKQEWGQDFAITINPGSQGKLKGNKIKGKIQVLDSRAFFE